MKYSTLVFAPLAYLSTVHALSPRLAKLWGDSALVSADVLDSDGCWAQPLNDRYAFKNYAEDLFIPLTTNRSNVEWKESVMTYNEPASCYVLECPEDIDCFDRILVIEGESEQQGQAYCVEDLGAPDLPGTSIPVEPTCGAPITYCNHITTDRITTLPKAQGGKRSIKIRFSCRESCAEMAEIAYKFRVYLSEETYANNGAGGTDRLDQYCDAAVDYNEFPSAMAVAGCGEGPCPELIYRTEEGTSSCTVSTALGVLISIMVITTGCV